MFISRVKYSGVEFAAGDARTHMLYKGAPTCEWKNICEYVKPKNDWPPFGLIGQYLGLGLNQ